MKKITILFVVTILISTYAFAQDTSKPAKIGIVNVQRLTLESNIGKAAQDKVNEFVQTKLNELQQENQTLQRDTTELESQRTVLSADAFTAKRNALQQRLLAFEQTQKEADRVLQRMQAEESQKFIKEAGPILKSIGEELGLSVIIDSTPQANPILLWYDQTLDITDIAIQRLNAATQSTTN